MEARNGQGGHAKETEGASALTTQREFQRTGTPRFPNLVLGARTNKIDFNLPNFKEFSGF